MTAFYDIALCAKVTIFQELAASAAAALAEHVESTGARRSVEGQRFRSGLVIAPTRSGLDGKIMIRSLCFPPTGFSWFIVQRLKQ